MDDTILPIAPHIWLFPCNDDEDNGRIQPGVGIICTTTQTILVDGGNGPAHARRIFSLLQQLNAPPVRYLIYTHHHWDHVFGAQIFDATTIGHDRCREFLLTTARQLWSRRYIARRIEENPRLKVSYTALMNGLGDEQALQVRVPSLTFSHKLHLVVDDLTIELEHVGGQHAADSIVVRVSAAGVIFLGDCYYAPPLHLRTSEMVADWKMLESLLDDRYEWYIEGHDLPQTRKEIRAALTEMKAAHGGRLNTGRRAATGG